MGEWSRYKKALIFFNSNFHKTQCKSLCSLEGASGDLIPLSLIFRARSLTAQEKTSFQLG